MKKLFRSKSKKIFAGVCGGISDYTNMDKTLVRFLFLLMFIYLGFSISICIYVAAYMVIPEEGQESILESTINSIKSSFQNSKKEEVADVG